MPKLDLQYCNNLLNALICIQKNIHKEKTIEVIYNDNSIFLQINPDMKYVDFSFRYAGENNCISIDLHDSNSQQSIQSSIRVYKRTVYAFDTNVHRYKTFISSQEHDVGVFDLIGFEDNVIKIPFDYDEETYFQYSTLYNLPPKDKLDLYKEVFYKCKKEMTDKSIARISYLNIEIPQEELDELANIVYSFVPLMKI